MHQILLGAVYKEFLQDGPLISLKSFRSYSR